MLVGPRIELPLGALRVEDLVLGVLGVICLLHLDIGARPRAVSLAVAGVAVAGVVSAVVASARGMIDPVTGLLYAVRPLEYWIALPAAALLLSASSSTWLRRMDVLLAVATVLQAAFAVAQYYFGIPVGFSHAAYTRAAGLTVGPYELGAMSAALAVYWVSRGHWVLASLSVVALAASISRVSILAAAAALLILSAVWVERALQRGRREGWRASLPRRRGSRAGVVVQVAAVIAAGLVLAFTVGLLRLPELPTQVERSEAAAPAAESRAPLPSASPEAEQEAEEAPTESTAAQPIAPPAETVTTRIADTSLLGSWRATGPVAAAVPRPATAAEYADIAYGHINDHLVASSAAAAGGEASNLVRFFRWHLILDTFDDPIDVVFGLGPSFVGPSVDGSYLRFFADGGLLGVGAWLVLILMWLRRSPLWMVCVTIVLLVGALFIDIVYAQRPMILFWTMLAISTVRTRAASDPQPAPAATSTPRGEDRSPARPLARV